MLLLQTLMSHIKVWHVAFFLLRPYYVLRIVLVTEPRLDRVPLLLAFSFYHTNVMILVMEENKRKLPWNEWHSRSHLQFFSFKLGICFPNKLQIFKNCTLQIVSWFIDPFKERSKIKCMHNFREGCIFFPWSLWFYDL